MFDLSDQPVSRFEVAYIARRIENHHPIVIG